MAQDISLLPGRILQRPGLPSPSPGFAGVVVHDERLTAVLRPDATLLCLYQGTLHGEGTLWDPAHDRLVWSDVENRRLLAWHPDGSVEVVIDGTYFMNGNALDATGRLIHCEHGRRCISRSTGNGDDRGGGAEPIVTHYDGKRLNSPNDLVVAADGAIWFTDPTFGLLVTSQGSLADPELDHRSVYRFDERDGSLRRMADFEEPNGLCFAPDGRTLYVTDTALSLDEIPGPQTGSTHEILAFDVAADGALSNRRLFWRTDHGVPDGLAVDARGWVWTTAGDGIHVLAPDGKRLGFFATPKVASNCAFGPGMTRLFVAAKDQLLAIDLSA